MTNAVDIVENGTKLTIIIIRELELLRICAPKIKPVGRLEAIRLLSFSLGIQAAAACLVSTQIFLIHNYLARGVWLDER